MNINRINKGLTIKLMPPTEHIINRLVFESKMGNLTNTVNELCAKYPEKTFAIRKFASSLQESNIRTIESATKKVSDKSKFSTIA